MKKKAIIILVLFVFIASFIFLTTESSFASNAEWGGWEITYPWNPPEPNLPQYIKYIYQISFWIGAFLAVIMIIIGGIEWSGAAANPQLKAAAKDKITRSIIGLLALFSIYIVLRTINPDLVRLKDQLPPGVNAGDIFYGSKVLTRSGSVFDLNTLAQDKKKCFCTEEENAWLCYEYSEEKKWYLNDKIKCGEGEKCDGDIKDLIRENQSALNPIGTRVSPKCK